MKQLFLSASVLAFAASLLACEVDYDEWDHGGYDAPVATGGGNGSTSTSTGADGGAAAAPMLAVVDTDQTMNVTPGDGVGVFIEYGAGGHWNVWWTCDTSRTQQPCNFVIGVTAASGAITNLDASQLTGGFATLSSRTQLDASSTTTTQLHGVKFDTDPGATITLSAQMGALIDGSFLFFVQKGLVNGGYTGPLSNPLSLVGSSP